ncbi:RNASEH1 [Mytilus edulis]|uniref:RnhA n=1 Tax=Mytilus edulis TaxID=6550 RepID=A0A8S3U9I1_MYTED|nr:RNASEH1 [Mytilus edulis]
MTELIGNTANDQATAYTDGSCMGNPGPCEAGAIIYTEDSRPAIRLHRPVAQRGSILLAELVAIVMVLEFCILERLHNTITTLKIFSDSQSAVGLLTLNWAPKSYIDVIRDIREHIEDLRTKGMEICILWTPGHANIQGNDEADLLAKQAAEEATQLLPKNNIITLQDVKQGAHKSVMLKWQRRWELSNTGRDLFEITPNVKNIPIFDYPTKKFFSIFIQLRTGHATLLISIKQRTGQNTTDLCSCGTKETQQHYLTECPNYESYREEMYHQITKKLESPKSL